VRVIDDTDANIGVMSLSQALELAQSKNLDVVEVSAAANPPVVRIISYDKYRYQLKKEEKKHAQKPTGGLKQVRVTSKAAENDLKVRATQADDFLTKGYKVEIMMPLRGREKYNQDWARKKLAAFEKMITVEHQITTSIRPGGRGLTMQIVRGKI
jgi:translation initiation factor IF-3